MASYRVLIAGLVLSLLALGSCTREARSPIATLDKASSDLYVSRVSDGDALQPLDPATLDDLSTSASQVLDIGTGVWVLSGDGSTFVSVEYARDRNTHSFMRAEDVTIVIRDGRSMTERLRFHPPAHVVAPYLSYDGTRLVVAEREDAHSGRSRDWWVLDTADGRVVSSVTIQLPTESWASTIGVDREAQQIYHLAVTGGPTRTGPQPASIVAYDLTTGAESGRLELSGVLAGSWLTSRTVPVGDSAYNVPARLSPGVALSPDGRYLAVAHADSEAVTVIDAQRLSVERVISPDRPARWWDWIPFVPRVANAKPAEGTERHATFSADGRYLYVFGLVAEVEDPSRPVYRGLGLTVVDIERGSVVANGFDAALIAGVATDPDERSIYVLVAKTKQFTGAVDWLGSQYLLYRLDASGLTIMAERELSGLHRLLFLPRR